MFIKFKYKIDYFFYMKLNKKLYKNAAYKLILCYNRC